MKRKFQTFKNVYVRGRIEDGENEWAVYVDCDKDWAVKKFKDWIRTEYDAPANRIVYIECVLASDAALRFWDGSEF